jgi:adenylate kinase
MSMSAKIAILVDYSRIRYTTNYMINQKHIEAILHWLGSGAINIFGLPFAGKDEQTARLLDILGGIKLGGGDILRASMTPEVRTYLDAGKLIPSSLYVAMVLPYLSKPEFRGKPLLLSSVGRWYGEEDGVMQVLTDADHPLMAVIYLVVSREDAHVRLEASKDSSDRGERADDDKQILATRFQEFEEKTMPVINHYRELGLVIEIDATLSREQVQDAILEQLLARSVQ